MAIEIKANRNKWDLMNHISFCIVKKNIDKMRR